MRISIINPFYDDVPKTVLEVTGRYRHVEALAPALARRGHEVVVVQAFHEDRIERRASVEFHYARVPQRSVARLRGGVLGIDLLMRGNVRRLVDAVADVRPDVVHMNGVTLLQPLAALAEWCAESGRPLTSTFHGGGKPLRIPWLAALERRVLKRCHGVFFTTRAHAQAWTSTGLLQPDQVIPCMEVSSTFTPADRSAARARTGIHGDPVFAWNARLGKNKDPSTALKGFDLIRRRWPGARLYMIYWRADWEVAVRRTIAELGLQDVVEMRGLIPPAAVEDFLNSADFFIQTSRYEVASFAVLEAMSCGVIPVLSDIPPFRAMIDDGSCGILFPVGDFKSLAERTLQTDIRMLPELSRKVRAHFERALSYDSIGAIYESAFLAAA